MDKAVERHCRACHGCQLVARPDPPEPLKPTTMPDGPWQDLAVDLLGPLPSGHSILVVVDYYSRFYEYDILKSTTTEKVIDSLDEIFSRQGWPVTLKSDNGPQFRSEEFQEYCEHYGVKHIKVTAKWAQANGEVERQNASIMKRIRIAQAEGLNWKRELRIYVAKYRGLEHATTGKSPAELNYNRKFKGKLPDFKMDIREDIETRDRDAEMKAKAKSYADERRGAQYSSVEVGDQVLVRQDKVNKFTTTFNPTPYAVVDKRGNSVIVESPSGVKYSRNTTHVRKYVSDPVEGDHDNGPNGQVMNSSGTVSETPVMTPGSPQPKTPMRGNLAQRADATKTPEPRPSRIKRAPPKYQDYVMN